MIDRRILLASAAGLAGLIAFRWLRETSPGYRKEGREVRGRKDRCRMAGATDAAQYNILRKQGTEPPGSSPLLKEHRKGIFACAGCDLPLYSSETKFESGTGWPSFWKPLDNAVGETEDTHLRHGAHRNPLPPLRRPSRPRLRRRSEADGLALLHGRTWRWCSIRRRRRRLVVHLRHSGCAKREPGSNPILRYLRRREPLTRFGTRIGARLSLANAVLPARVAPLGKNAPVLGPGFPFIALK